MGADPLVSNIASASAWALADYTEIAELSSELELEPKTDPGPAPSLLHGFLVRKAEKTHGTGRRIEGFLQPGAPVVIVDDVCTTGGSTITAIEATRDAGMTVAGVLCLVDRDQGGRDNIERALAESPATNAHPLPRRLHRQRRPRRPHRLQTAGRPRPSNPNHAAPQPTALLQSVMQSQATPLKLTRKFVRSTRSCKSTLPAHR